MSENPPIVVTPEMSTAQWFVDHFRATGRKNSECRDLIGRDWTVVTRIAAGKYDGNIEPVIAAIEHYRNLLGRAPGGFVKTPFSESVWRVLNYSKRIHRMGLVVSRSRIGKTTSLLAWLQKQPEGKAFYAIAPAAGGTVMLLRRVVRSTGNTPGRMTLEALQSWCEDFFRSDMTLVIDDAHCILPSRRSQKAPALDTLRQIHDATHVHIVFAGAQRLEEEMRGDGAFQFEQFLGRIRGKLVFRRKLQRADVEPLANAFGRLSVGTLDELVEIANGPCGLDEVSILLQEARRRADDEHVKLRDRHIDQVRRIWDTIESGELLTEGRAA